MTHEIEVCTNTEWWRECGPLGDCDDDAISPVIDDIFRALDDAGFESVRAKGQRTLCHGWNGANTFRRKSCWGIGTHARMSDAEWARAEAAIEPIINRARNESAKARA